MLALVRSNGTRLADPDEPLCAHTVTTEDARSIAALLEDAGLEPDRSGAVLRYWITDDRYEWLESGVEFRAVLPDGRLVQYGG